MKRIQKLLVVFLTLVIVLSAAGCKKKESLAGTWVYEDPSAELSAVYNLKDDGTGTYAVTVSGVTVDYELKYELKDGHMLVRFINDEVFSEDDVFDSEYTLKDAKTLIIKDTSGLEMTFNKQ